MLIDIIVLTPDLNILLVKYIPDIISKRITVDAMNTLNIPYLEQSYN